MFSTKTYYIENLGCAKNQIDAEIMIAALDEAGWEKSAAPDLAELIIVNTCGFIEPAKKESVDVLIGFRDAFPDTKLVAAGCLSQRYADDLAESMPDLDGIFGNYAVSRVAEFAERLTDDEDSRVFVPETEGFEDGLSINRKVLLSRASSAYVKLSEGCNNNCSFCAIPLIRGRNRSRRPASIIEEIKHLTADCGIKEINLIAQDLGSYGEDLCGTHERRCLLPQLLGEIKELPGDFMVRMLYIHPDKFPVEILDICASSNGRIIPYFDIPFQHASKPVLSAMNRRGDSEIYLELLETIRAKLSEAVIRTTFMLGFPGERRDDVEELERFISAANLDWAGFFVYSPEEDTSAYELEKPRKLKKRAKTAEKDLERLQDLQTEISSKRLARFVGSRQRLLVEEAVEQEDLWLCRGWMHAPEVDGLVVLHADKNELAPGQMVEAEIIGINGIDLEARLLPLHRL